jgi:putative transcriptional regulator
MITVAQGTILNKVSELMGRHRMNISDLSKAAGISYQTAYSIYHNRTARIDFETLAGLCEALKADVGDIFSYTPHKNGGS